jgi:hypothetical protein
MERWKPGIMANKELPLALNFPIFHYSNIPFFQSLRGEPKGEEA